MSGALGFYKYSDLIPYWEPLLSFGSKEDLISEIKSKFHCKNVLLTNHGRTAMFIALKSINAKKILVPSLICSSVVEAILDAGKEPIFIDVNEDLEIDSEKLDIDADAIIIPSFGGKLKNISEVIEIAKRKNWIIIDDAAQSFGAVYGKPVGMLGDFGILSFNIGKNLVAGAGGALITNSQINNSLIKESEITALLRLIAQIFRLKYRKFTRLLFYFIDKYQTKQAYKLMSNADAKVVLSQVRNSEKIVSIRKRNASILKKIIKYPYLDGKENIFTKFFLVSEDRDRIRKQLRRNSVETEQLAIPCHLRKEYAHIKRAGELKMTERVYKRILMLPVGPSLSEKDIIRVGELVNETKLTE